MENLNYKQHDLCILYGSQTGTAKLAAEELERELCRYDYKTSTMAMNSYDIMDLPEENFIIFIVSTTGYGEAPSNMKNFWKFLLRKDLPEDSLENLKFTIFGLGDSSYEKFNYVAKMLNNRLKQLSAELIYPVGLGDDQHDFGYEGEFDPWCKDLIDLLNKNYFLGKNLVKEKISYQPKYVSEIYDNHNVVKNTSSDQCDINKSFFYQNYEIFEGFIDEAKIITGQNSIKKVFNIKIKTHGSNTIMQKDIQENKKKFCDILSKNTVPKYHPGDVLLLYPLNDEESVTKMLTLINLKGDETILIKCNKNETKSLFPEKIQARDFFKRWLNINGTPTRYFCNIAADYTDNEIHREKILLFASKTSVNK